MYADFVKSNADRRILCIDMNSYFASVEQQANPKLQNKPIIVTGEGKRTIVIAASKEAKRYGIGTGMKIHEAEKLCPHIIRVYGDGEKYASLQNQILEIIERYFLCIEIASIDECYIDAKGITEWDTLARKAQAIKEAIRDEIGPYITCSIGISTNKVIAKLASNMKKPDGLVILTPEDMPKILPEIKVGDISGIGRQLQKRLNEIGIYKLKDFSTFPEEILRKNFKEHLTLFFLRIAQGIDPNEVVPYTRKPQPKSFGHEITFPKDTANMKELEKTIFALLGRCVFRMKKYKMKSRCIGIYIRYKDLTAAGENNTFKIYTDDLFSLYTKALEVFYGLYDGKNEIRQIGVHLSSVLSADEIPTELFPGRNDKVTNIIQIINEKYGQFTIAPLRVYNTQALSRKIHGFYKSS